MVTKVDVRSTLETLAKRIGNPDLTDSMVVRGNVAGDQVNLDSTAMVKVGKDECEAYIAANFPKDHQIDEAKLKAEGSVTDEMIGTGAKYKVTLGAKNKRTYSVARIAPKLESGNRLDQIVRKLAAAATIHLADCDDQIAAFDCYQKIESVIELDNAVKAQIPSTLGYVDVEVTGRTSKANVRVKREHAEQTTAVA